MFPMWFGTVYTPRAISRMDLMPLWYVHRILRIVSTISISFLLLSLRFPEESALYAEPGHFCMPINLVIGVFILSVPVNPSTYL